MVLVRERLEVGVTFVWRRGRAMDGYIKISEVVFMRGSIDSRNPTKS